MSSLVTVLCAAAAVCLLTAVATRLGRAAGMARGLDRGALSATRVEQVADGSPARGSRLRDVGRWIEAGTAVELGGRRYAGGFIYFGSQLGTVSAGGGDEPALIDPSAKIFTGQVNPAVRRLGPNPSYRDLGPEARAAHLEWLIGGRRQHDADPGHALLLLYGLERRALADLRDASDAGPARVAIGRELLELLEVYRGEDAFARDATLFLGALALLVEDASIHRAAALLPAVDGELPVGLRAAFARAARDGDRLTADLALAFVRQDPQVTLRAGASRCAAEFDQLFRQRFARRHQDGMRLEPCKRRVSVSYRPASPSFVDAVRLSTDLPDVVSLVGPRRRLQAIADSCCADLEEFSRFVARRPEQRTSIQAMALLPRELASSLRSDVLDSLVSRLADAADSRRPMDAIVLLDAAGTGAGRRNRRDQLRLLHGLEALGFGVEPDLRFGGPALRAGSGAVVFRIGADAPRVLGESHAAAMLLLHLGAMVGAANGGIGDAERAALARQIDDFADLTQGERERLRAHLRWLTHEPPDWSGLARRFDILDRQQREAVGSFLVRIARADGRVEPSEVAALERAFALLGLEANAVHQELHEADDSDRGPVLVRSGREDEVHPLPARGAEVRPSTALDMEIVTRRLRETAAVSSLLASVFVDDGVSAEPCAPEQVSTVAPDPAPVAGLDPAHGALLCALGQRATWTRIEYEAEAESRDLLPDGALEVMNDLALERCGAPLSEGDDPLQIDMQVFAELTS